LPDTEVKPNVVAITEPDVFYGNNRCVFYVGSEFYAQQTAEILYGLEDTVTCYVATGFKDLGWIMNAYTQCEVCLLDTEHDQFLTGLLIDKPKTYYYNNTIDCKQLNYNSIEDPVSFLIDWMNSQRGINGKKQV